MLWLHRTSSWLGRELNSDEDMEDLYTVRNRVRHILLWCYLPKEVKIHLNVIGCLS